MIGVKNLIIMNKKLTGMDPVEVWVLKEQLEFVPLKPIHYHIRNLEGKAGLCTEMLLSNLQYKGKLLLYSFVIIFHETLVKFESIYKHNKLFYFKNLLTCFNK
jgi:hypothetical protein